VKRKYKTEHQVKDVKISTILYSTIAKNENFSKTVTFLVYDNGVRRKFSWGVSVSGIWWSFVFAVRSL